MSSDNGDTDSCSDSGSFVQTTSDTPQGIADHFNPILKAGSDHESDEEWVDPPGYESDEDEEQEELDNTFYANINQDRLNKPVNEWCSCGGCVTMPSEQESVCCHESHFITPHRGDKKCVTLVEMFTVNVVSKEGLDFGRYLYSMNIPDPVKKDNFLKKKLTNKNYRFCAYKMFINMISWSYIRIPTAVRRQYCGSTAAVRRQYCGSTAAVRRQYCGSTAAVLRQYRGSTAAVPWQYRDNTYIRILIQFFHVFFDYVT